MDKSKVGTYDYYPGNYYEVSLKNMLDSCAIHYFGNIEYKIIYIRIGKSCHVFCGQESFPRVIMSEVHKHSDFKIFHDFMIDNAVHQLNCFFVQFLTPPNLKEGKAFTRVYASASS